MLEPRNIDVLLEEHERNRRDHAGRLWARFMLESWFRAFVDAAPRGAFAPAYVVVDEIR